MIIGHERPLQFLKKAYEHNKVPHALLFWGPSDIGKRTVAASFARGLICDTKTFLGCGTCQSCDPENAVLKSHRISIRDIKEEIKDERQGISIDVIRALQERLTTTSLIGKPKVIIIDDAEDLTPEASNALLKTLEEPPENAYIILTGTSRESVLPTISSRTAPLRFSRVPQKTLEMFLEERHAAIPQDKRISLARFAQGRPGRLLRGIDDPEEIADAQKKYSFVFGLLANPLYAAFQKIDGAVKNEESLGVYLEYFFPALRSVFFLQQNLDAPYILKIPESVAKTFGVRHEPRAYARIFEKLYKTHARLQETNVNARIAFESFILDI